MRALFLTLLLAGCASSPTASLQDTNRYSRQDAELDRFLRPDPWYDPAQDPTREVPEPDDPRFDKLYQAMRVPPFQPSIQGYLGVLSINDDSYRVDTNFGDLDESDIDTLPTGGFTLQWPVMGDRFELGFELGSSVAWDNDSETYFRTNPTIIIVDAKNNLFLWDFSVGAHAAFDLTRKARFHGGAGPLIQYGSVDLDFDDDGIDDLDDDGFGTGYYARIGFEYYAYRGHYAGLMARYVDTEVDFDGDIDKLEYEGWQFVFTLTRKF